ncbi:hypothetical protein EDB85DRAFT_2048093, partial [Lactarius pseudohatsudake]
EKGRLRACVIVSIWVGSVGEITSKFRFLVRVLPRCQYRDTSEACNALVGERTYYSLFCDPSLQGSGPFCNDGLRYMSVDFECSLEAVLSQAGSIVHVCSGIIFTVSLVAVPGSVAIY